MKKAKQTTTRLSDPGSVRVGGRGAPHRAPSQESINRFFLSVGEKLREGRSAEAERLLLRTIQNYDHSPDDFANLKRLLSFTLETAGRYEESLEAVQAFEDEENLGRLSIETQIRVTTHSRSHTTTSPTSRKQSRCSGDSAKPKRMR
jgi:hypothetical protein